MQTTTIKPRTNAELATDAHTALVKAGITAAAAKKIVNLLPPRGHHELTGILRADSGALAWLPALWVETLADRLHTRTADAAHIQQLLATAAQQ